MQNSPFVCSKVKQAGVQVLLGNDSSSRSILGAGSGNELERWGANSASWPALTVVEWAEMSGVKYTLTLPISEKRGSISVLSANLVELPELAPKHAAFEGRRVARG